MKVKFKKFHSEAKVPTRGTSGAAAFDLYCIEETKIKPGETVFFRTGLGVELPEGYFIMIAPRGSLCIKKHLDMPHSVGIGDEDFVGEYLVPYRNIGKQEVTIEKGERFAQMLFIKYSAPEFVEVDELKETGRGKGSFGSTGKF